jgi:cell division protein FtsW
MTSNQPAYDRLLLFGCLSLLVLGLLMVASASAVISDRAFGGPFHFLIHQGAYLLAGCLLAALVLRFKVQTWYKLSVPLLLISMMLLLLVLVPGVGRQVNGSMRWIGFGQFGIQVSEFAKLAAITYLAGYLVRRNQEVQMRVSGFIKPMLLLTIMAALLLAEPDFGAASVIMATALGMMFLAGVRMWQFGVLFAGVLGALSILAISSPYRMARLTGFLNPWARPFDSGYQLTQSLMAFGRGGWWGVGLGDSIQKLFYLPEAHTDFLFAVLAEELGLIGVLIVIALFVLVVWRAFYIGRKAYLRDYLFSAYLSYGIGLWLALQAMVNMGVNTGLLPTKGLTLPFMSYGGSSMLITCVAVALLLRVDYELRR